MHQSQIPLSRIRPADRADFSQSAESPIEFRALIDHVVKWNGMELGIEYLPGATRFAGTAHARKLKSAYGHIRGYKGEDKEALDCYVKPELLKTTPGEFPDKGNVFAVFQIDPTDGSFDEMKIMVGWDTLAEAEEAYLAEMPSDRMGKIQSISLDGLQAYKR